MDNNSSHVENKDVVSDWNLAGLTSREAGMVLSVMGIANCFGRVAFGQALDLWKDKVGVCRFINPILHLIYYVSPILILTHNTWTLKISDHVAFYVLCSRSSFSQQQ